MNITLVAVGTLVLLAVLCEAVTEQLKDLLPEEAPPNVKRLISLGVGLVLAVLLKVSLFEGATGSVQIAGIILAGLLCSRGSNYIHDLFSMFSKVGDAAAGQSTNM